jgi:hypothetical protein
MISVAVYQDCGVFLLSWNDWHFRYSVVVGSREVTQQAQQVSTHLRIFMFSGPLPENTKTLAGIIPDPY